MKMFDIEYAVDNGAYEWRDRACVLAYDKYDAQLKLKRYYEAYADSSTYVSEVFRVDEFTGNVFTGRFGCGMV